MQLIDLIVADLTAHKTDLQTQTLVVVGSDPISVEILKGSVRTRHDLTTTHEEADTRIIQQVADDTYIFNLLLHFCHLGNISCNFIYLARSFDQTALRPSVIKRIRQIDVKYITHITSFGV